MTLLHGLCLFIVWMNLDESLQQSAVTCKAPVIENGYVTDDFQEYKEDEILQYECDFNYRRSEGRESRCTAIGPRSDWSPTPACVPTKCKLPLPPPNGTRYEPEFRSVFLPGESVSVTCSERFWTSTYQNQSLVTICKDDGQWTVFPECRVALTCKAPVIENGYVTDAFQKYKEDEILQYECDFNYRRSEERESRCTAIGPRADWSPTPACVLTKCKVPLPPPYGTRYSPLFKSVFLPGQSIRVTCGERFWISTHLDQTAEILCGDNGQWAVPPVCRATQ